jgi:CDP-diacylglycerol--glycerol-3-phosphate 3-phosphatidyltransferase
VLDGYVARKTQTQSVLGARLDSFADLLLFMTITVSVFLWLGNEVFIYLPWIAITVFIRCTNIAIAAYKYHSFAILHTWANKLTGILVFIMPLFLLYQQFTILWPVCVMAVLSAAEETLIHITSTNLNLDRQSIFRKQ